MKTWQITLVVLGLCVMTHEGAMAAPRMDSPSSVAEPRSNQEAPILLAKGGDGKGGKRGGAAKKGGGTQRILTTEGRSKKGSRTKIDFDEAAIDGNRRTPAGIAITKNRPDQAYDLINLRLRWHPEMVQSTTNLETGRGR